MSFELKKDNSFVRKMAKEPELKRCPFCGGEAEVVGHYVKGGPNNYQYFVRCKRYKVAPMVYGMNFKKKEKAIEAWNRRVSDETTNGRP